MTYKEFEQYFPDEKSAIEYFIKIRYNNELKCNHCKNTVIYGYKNRLKIFYCKECNNTFSVFKGTIFEKSSTSIKMWFYAIKLFLNSKKGLPAKQLQREIGVTYKTAWRMLNKIRLAMSNYENEKIFKKLVEIDETYVGGRPRNNKHDKEKICISKYGRGTAKIPVVGIKERKTGNVVAKVMLPDRRGRRVSGQQLYKYISDNCEIGTLVISDEFRSYLILDKENSGFRHKVIKHRNEFSRGRGIHTNGIEGHWARIKRCRYGIYHYISLKYLQMYINENSFRQNHLNLNSVKIFNKLLKQSIIINKNIGKKK